MSLGSMLSDPSPGRAVTVLLSAAGTATAATAASPQLQGCGAASP